MNNRFCGSCSLCCKLPPMHGTPTDSLIQISKPANQWCEHAAARYRVKDRGCLIYDVRPRECLDFACMWLKGELPDEFQPLKSHCVIYFPVNNNPDNLIVVMCDPAYASLEENHRLWAWVEETSFTYPLKIFARETSFLVDNRKQKCTMEMQSQISHSEKEQTK